MKLDVIKLDGKAAGSVEDGGLRDVVADAEDKSGQFVLRESYRVIKFCFRDEFGNCRPVVRAADIEADDVQIFGSVFCDQRV